jgi:hypothetical protein
MSFSTISQLARRYKIPPCRISDLFYRRILSDEICPVVSGRRIIPGEYVATIEAVLRERGLLPATEPVEVAQ